jgi:hypothetical protein
MCSTKSVISTGANGFIVGAAERPLYFVSQAMNYIYSRNSLFPTSYSLLFHMQRNHKILLRRRNEHRRL